MILTDLVEPVHPTILFVQPKGQRSKSIRPASPALGRVGAVAEYRVLISNVTEPAPPLVRIITDESVSKGSKVIVPMDFRRLLEETQGNTMNRSISPALIEEPTRAIKVLKVSLISRASPKI